MTNNANQLPSQLDASFSSVAPTYTNTPADGPYNMTYVIGSWNQVTWGVQAHVDYISEMNNRRLWNTATAVVIATLRPAQVSVRSSRAGDITSAREPGRASRYRAMNEVTKLANTDFLRLGGSDEGRGNRRRDGGESMCDLDAAARVLPRDSAREPDARTGAAGVVTDIGPGRPLSPPVDLVDGNYEDLAGADLVMADHEHVFGTAR
jgi:hypothetical protein